MPLEINCPNGCVIRVPTGRLNRSIRCPHCKVVFSVARSEENQGKSIQKFDHATELEQPDQPDQPAPTIAPVSPAAGSAITGIPANRPSPSKAVRLPPVLSPGQIRLAEQQRRSKNQEIVARFQKSDPVPASVGEQEGPVSEFQIVQVVEKGQAKSTKLTNHKDASPAESWQSRLKRANQDRLLMARFWGVMLFVVGLIHVAPVVVYGVQIQQSVAVPQWPSWCYWQILVACLHALYGIFLLQIPDWSALRGVAYFSLVVAFALGVVSTGFYVGRGSGWVASSFGLSDTLVQPGIIWTLAMLAVSSLVAYGCGKEATNWERAENLLREIVDQPSTPASKTDPEISD